MSTKTCETASNTTKKALSILAVGAIVAAASLLTNTASAGPFKPPPLFGGQGQGFKPPALPNPNGFPVGPSNPLKPPKLPINGNGGCPGGLVGCNPNTWGPGKPVNGGGNWNGGGFGTVNLNFGIAAQPAYATAVASDDCYFVRRRAYMPGVGRVFKRVMVCN